jgi:hypothetical protein
MFHLFTTTQTSSTHKRFFALYTGVNQLLKLKNGGCIMNVHVSELIADCHDGFSMKHATLHEN